MRVFRLYTFLCRKAWTAATSASLMWWFMNRIIIEYPNDYRGIHTIQHDYVQMNKYSSNYRL